MPDRLIRDELLTSERYWSVSPDAQRFYIHLLLNVDDSARFSGKNFTLRTSCFPGQDIEPEKIETLLSELVKSDLVREYQHNGDRFVFVPRFRNRKRYAATSKYPTPPNEINDMDTKKADLSQPQVSPESASSQPQVRRGGVGVGKT